MHSKEIAILEAKHMQQQEKYLEQIAEAQTIADETLAQVSTEMERREIEVRDGPVPFQQAIKYIQNESQLGVGMTDTEIAVEILRLASGDAFKIEGCLKWGLSTQYGTGFKARQHPQMIDRKFLSNCIYEHDHGEAGLPALVEKIELPGKTKRLGVAVQQKYPDKYYYPTVRMDQIRHHFPEKE